MTFRITAEEKAFIVSKRVYSYDPIGNYKALINSLRIAINKTASSLQDLEDFMAYRTQLKNALADDFDRIEKLVFDAKALIKKMERIKIASRKTPQ